MQAYNNFVLVSHNEILIIFIIEGTGYSLTKFLDLFKLATFESKNFEAGGNIFGKISKIGSEA